MSRVVPLMTPPASSVTVTKAVLIRIATPAAVSRPVLRRICAQVRRAVGKEFDITHPSGVPW